MAVPCLTIKNMTMAYGDFIIQRDLDFTINRGDIFIIMGGSGCGKSTLLMHLIGLQSPAKGDVLYGEESLWQAEHKDAATHFTAYRRVISKWRTVEFNDLGREYSAAYD